MELKQKVTGTLECHAIGALLAGREWHEDHGMPMPDARDWSVMSGMGAVSCLQSAASHDPLLVPADRARCLRSVRALSFYPYLYESLMSQARAYAEAGVGSLMLSADGLAEGVRCGLSGVPAAYWILLQLCMDLRRESGGDFELGLRIPYETGEWAADIACRCGFDFFLAGECPGGLCGVGVARLCALRNRLGSADRRATGIVLDLRGGCEGHLKALPELAAAGMIDAVLDDDRTSGRLAAETGIPVWHACSPHGVPDPGAGYAMIVDDGSDVGSVPVAYAGLLS